MCLYAIEFPTLDQAIARINTCWDEEVVTRLPLQLDEMARHLHAFERIGAIKKPSDLLRGLLARALQDMSFQDLAIWASLMKVADISANAWRQRLRHSSAWLQWLLSELLATSRPFPAIPASHGYPVWLVDATCLQQDGDSGDDWRLHVVYDWIQARLVSVTLTDGHSEREIMLASAELREQNRDSHVRTPIDAKRLADFLAKIEAHEAVLLQRQRDIENQVVVYHIEQNRVPSREVPRSASMPSLRQSDATEQPASRFAPVDLTTLQVYEEFR